MRNHQVRRLYAESVRDTFQIRYEHAIVRRYALSQDEGVANFCICLYVRHKLEVRYM